MLYHTNHVQVKVIRGLPSLKDWRSTVGPFAAYSSLSNTILSRIVRAYWTAYTRNFLHSQCDKPNPINRMVKAFMKNLREQTCILNMEKGTKILVKHSQHFSTGTITQCPNLSTTID